jgi:hypothetical protein
MPAEATLSARAAIAIAPMGARISEECMMSDKERNCLGSQAVARSARRIQANIYRYAEHQGCDARG